MRLTLPLARPGMLSVAALIGAATAAVLAILGVDAAPGADSAALLVGITLAAIVIAAAAVVAARRDRVLRNAAEAARATDYAALCAIARIGEFRRDCRTGAAWWSAELHEIMGLTTPDGTAPEWKSAIARVHANDRAALTAAIARVEESARGQVVEFRVSHDLRGERILRAHLRVETDHHGHVSAIRGIVLDLTDRRLAAERLRDVERLTALGRLTAGLSHDFNNLLCAITLSLEMLEEVLPIESDPAHDLVASIRRASERGMALTSQLLAYSGRPTLRPRRVPLDAALRDEAVRLEDALGGTGSRSGGTISLGIELSGDPGLVSIEPTLLGAAIEALALVARDNMRGNGRLSLRARKIKLDAAAAAVLGLTTGHYGELSVRDEGTRWSADMLSRLGGLEPAFGMQPDSEQKVVVERLALAAGVAMQAGGGLRIEPAPGGGCLARLLLPHVDTRDVPVTGYTSAPISREWSTSPTSTALIAVEHRSASGSPLNALRILYVEDDDAVRVTAQAMLVRDGAAVTSAGNAAEAIGLLGSDQQFDLLLSDVMLPGGASGLDVVDAARRLRPGLPALLASAYAAPEQELGRSRPTGVDLLPKPFRRGELIDAIGRATQ